MRFERKGGQIFLNGEKINPSTRQEVCGKYFSAESLKRLRRDIEKYGRVHVAIVFVDSNTIQEVCLK